MKTIYLGLSILIGVGVATGRAQNSGAGGVISGSVTANAGTVRAFRVKARDVAHRISYTVFTVKGRYQIFNLPAGTYDVWVVEEGYDSLAGHAEVTAGRTSRIDLAITAVPDPSAVELVDFDTLYPPSAARDVMVESCFPCHSSAGKGHLGRATSAWHRKGGKTEAAWRAGVDRMFRRPGGFPLVTDSMVRPEQKEAIVQYLTRLFPPEHSERDLKLDPILRDEGALAEAVYVQYELQPSHNIHDAFPSQVTPGRVWLSGSLGAVVAVDTQTLDADVREKVWRIPPPDDRVFVHGIIEDRGRVYWTEIAGEHIGVLDPTTDDLQRYPVGTKGAWQHTLRADTKGNIWFSNFTSASLLGRFDPSTNTVAEYDLLEKWKVRGWNGYGLTVDSHDRVWAVGLTTPAIGMYDSRADRWATYSIASPARRLAVDAKGRVWACQFYGNALSRIDPATGRVTEFPLPLKYGSAYEVWPDSEDNLWVTNDVYNSLVKFDQASSRYTYVPYPDLEAHTPKLETDADGALWFGMRVGLESDPAYRAGLGGTSAPTGAGAPRWKLTVLREHGNVRQNP
jgi:streptogramin lyase